MPILYVVSAYLVLAIPFLMAKVNFPTFLLDILFGMLLLFGSMNLVVVLTVGRMATRVQILNCARIVKYGLIPFFVIGAGLVVLSFLLIFIPVPITIFVAPALAFTLCLIGWLVLVLGSTYSMAYIVRAFKERVNGGVLSVFAGIFQFFFVMDVIFLIILACKDRIYRRKTRQL
ncbi:MAG: hypothetical protein ACI4EX_02605 [Lachnospiraceae bacterium]